MSDEPRKDYIVDTTNDRVKVEPVPGGVILKVKPKRGRQWLHFSMPAHVASMTADLVKWALEDDRVRYPREPPRDLSDGCPSCTHYNDPNAPRHRCDGCQWLPREKHPSNWARK